MVRRVQRDFTGPAQIVLDRYMLGARKGRRGLRGEENGIQQYKGLKNLRQHSAFKTEFLSIL